MNEEPNNLSQTSYSNSEIHLDYQTPQLRKHGTIHDITLTFEGSSSEGTYLDVEIPGPPIS